MLSSARDPSTYKFLSQDSVPAQIVAKQFKCLQILEAAKSLHQQCTY